MVRLGNGTRDLKHGSRIWASEYNGVCVQVKVEGDNEPQPSAPREEGVMPFVFVGTKENIANAKVLVEYHVAHLKVPLHYCHTS